MIYWRREWQTTLYEKLMNCFKRQNDITPQKLSPSGLKVSNMLLSKEKRTTNNLRKNEAVGPKWKWHSAADVSGDGSKIQCCKEQYYIGTWNVRSMDQGKLVMVKQEMVRINIDILRISEPKWMGMDKFNSDDQYIHYCGQESHRRNGATHIINNSLKCNVWAQPQ